MREIGPIKQIQIQRASLKIGQKPYRYYDPSPLQVVRTLLLSARGVVGITEGGEAIIDVHHADHPTSKNRRTNGISLGFTSHYVSMRTQFGPHLLNGCAGENILVETEYEQALSDLEHGIAIKRAKTGHLVYLTNIMVAAPCVEFSQFAVCDIVPLAGEWLKETLQFLHDGRRGFYATLAPQRQQATIQVGDIVLALDPT